MYRVGIDILYYKEEFYYMLWTFVLLYMDAHNIRHTIIYKKSYTDHNYIYNT